MNVERAREILDPEHRENYDGMEAVNEACRMGRDALGKLVPLRPYPDGDKSIMACPRCGSGEYLHNEYGKTKQVARCGNAVCPPMATALVRANLPEWCSRTITTMEELEKAVTA